VGIRSFVTGADNALALSHAFETISLSGASEPGTPSICAALESATELEKLPSGVRVLTCREEQLDGVLVAINPSQLSSGLTVIVRVPDNPGVASTVDRANRRILARGARSGFLLIAADPSEILPAGLRAVALSRALGVACGLELREPGYRAVVSMHSEVPALEVDAYLLADLLDSLTR
jgi:hypothetical protein